MCTAARRICIFFSVACCCTEARISQAITTDSFGISEGMCAWGNRCACTQSQVCFLLLNRGRKKGGEFTFEMSE